MKYSFMSFSTPELSLSEMLEVARKYGYDGIEPRLDNNHAHGVEVSATASERSAIRQQAAGAGIEMACLATSLKFANAVTAEDTIAAARERIDLAGDLGAPAIRVFGGSFPDMDRDQGVDQTARTLTRVADHAQQRGVTICFETHDVWCDPADVAAVLSRVNHPAIACNWDIMHPVRVAKVTIDAAFEALKPWIRHLHIHDGEATGMLPIGTGWVDHRRAMELLKTINYTGFLSGEWIKWEPYDIHLPRELAMMKRYEQEIG
jgi:sugar phosphate isomerase/epimerase